MEANLGRLDKAEGRAEPAKPKVDLGTLEAEGRAELQAEENAEEHAKVDSEVEKSEDGGVAKKKLGLFREPRHPRT